MSIITQFSTKHPGWATALTWTAELIKWSFSLTWISVAKGASYLVMAISSLGWMIYPFVVVGANARYRIIGSFTEALWYIGVEVLLIIMLVTGNKVFRLFLTHNLEWLTSLPILGK